MAEDSINVYSLGEKVMYLNRLAIICGYVIRLPDRRHLYGVYYRLERENGIALNYDIHESKIQPIPEEEVSYHSNGNGAAVRVYHYPKAMLRLVK